MSKEKQIEELTNELVFTSNYGTYNAVANYLVNKGYRKQSEGEWVWKMKIEPQAQNRLYCSVCDEECLGKNNYYVNSNFCPYCGAKMKGGAE